MVHQNTPSVISCFVSVKFWKPSWPTPCLQQPHGQTHLFICLFVLPSDRPASLSLPFPFIFSTGRTWKRCVGPKPQKTSSFSLSSLRALSKCPFAFAFMNAVCTQLIAMLVFFLVCLLVSAVTWAGCIMGFWRLMWRWRWSTPLEPTSRSSTSSSTTITLMKRSASAQGLIVLFFYIIAVQLLQLNICLCVYCRGWCCPTWWWRVWSWHAVGSTLAFSSPRGKSVWTSWASPAAWSPSPCTCRRCRPW